MKRSAFCFVLTLAVISFGFNNNSLKGLKSPECLGQKFARFRVKKPDGSKFSNADLKNKVVFVGFWQQASPCCTAELDAFNKMFEKLSDSKEFVFVVFSPDQDSIIQRAVNEKAIKYNFLHVSEKDCVTMNHGFGFPSNFILDKTGKIVYYIPQKVIGSNDVAAAVVLDEYYPKIKEFL